MVRIETLNVLDARVKGLLKVVGDLKRQNAIMAMQLKTAGAKLDRQTGDQVGRWESERQMVRDRIESVLNELELVANSPRGSVEVNDEE